MLEIKNVSKTYRNAQVKAIDSINLTIEDGDIYGFIGPNGAGKSTMIKCITGIHPFEEGDILLDGVSILKDPLACKRRSPMFPIIPIFTNNCRESITFGLFAMCTGLKKNATNGLPDMRRCSGSKND